MVVDYAAMTGKPLPEKLKTAMLLMCGDHGIAKYGVSAYPQEVTLQMINGYMRETAGANVMARHAGADIFVVDIGTTFDLVRTQSASAQSGRGRKILQRPCNDSWQAEQALQVGMQIANGVLIMATIFWKLQRWALAILLHQCDSFCILGT